MANLPDIIEIGYSRTTLLLLFLAILASSAASAAAALHWLPVEISKTFLPTLAYIWMIASTLGFLRLGWLLLASNGPVLLIDRNGIRDVRVSKDMIPWDAVEKVSIRTSGERQAVTLKVTPEFEERLVTTPTWKVVAIANRALGIEGIVVNPIWLQVDAQTLFEVCNAYRAAYGRK
jgi:hypothetical protein